MRIKFTTVFPTVALLLLASANHAQSGHMSSEVPGVVLLTHSLDARKISPGATFQTRLIDTVHLNNGTKLPSGTLIIGTVVQDDMQPEGRVTFALRFSHAQLKNGKTIPIMATVLDVSTGTEAVENEQSVFEPVLVVPRNLTSQSDQVDVIDVNPGIDLHGRANSPNSGIFVATTKNDIRFPTYTQIALALAPGV
jgi:hypothetical protein